MGDFFPAIWRGFAWISKKQYWREEIRGDFTRNLERVCVDFKKQYWREICRGLAWISKNQY